MTNAEAITELKMMGSLIQGSKPAKAIRIAIAELEKIKEERKPEKGEVIICWNNDSPQKRYFLFYEGKDLTDAKSLTDGNLFWYWSYFDNRILTGEIVNMDVLNNLKVKRYHE